MEYGYCRVSTTTQNLARQLKEMKAAGIDERYIYTDKETGRTFNRQSYNLLVGTPQTAPLLREGDLLTISSVDRLGRNYTEIERQWRYITKELKADIRVLDMPLLDTRSRDEKDIDRTFVADLVLQILSYAAAKEVANNKARQEAGIKAMPIDETTGKRMGKKGRPTGRPSAQYPANWKEVYDNWKSENITATAAMQELGLKRNTFYNLVKRYEA